MPTDIPVIDTLVAIYDTPSALYDRIRPQLRDETGPAAVPTSYLFDKGAAITDIDNLIPSVLHQMDRFNVERAMIEVSDDMLLAQRALTQHPDRFFASYTADPNGGMAEVRTIIRMKREWDIKAVTAYPMLGNPPRHLKHRNWYPIYAKCVELGLPFVPTMGVPGPRVPFGPQDVANLDEICYFFPELTVVTRHGCEPWVDLMVKLLQKWPNLYFSTTAFAPKYYAKEIIDFANTRGAEKIIYGGYFPIGLTLERIFAEMPHVPLRDHVWPLFLRDNARRVFGLDK
ncbi:MAG TPA: amidohydrolase family protein [Pseudonocardia sp.]